MLHARAADTSVRARDVACRKVRVSAWRTRTAPIKIKAWAVWVEADRGVEEAVRVVEVVEEWVVGAKAVVVVDVPVVAAVAVAEAEWAVVEAPEAAAVIVPAAVVEVVREAVVKAAAAAVVDGRAAAADPVADPAVVVAVERDRAVSKLQTRSAKGCSASGAPLFSFPPVHPERSEGSLLFRGLNVSQSFSRKPASQEIGRTYRRPVNSKPSRS